VPFVSSRHWGGPFEYEAHGRDPYGGLSCLINARVYECSGNLMAPGRGRQLAVNADPHGFIEDTLQVRTNASMMQQLAQKPQ
jgi:hypothetical protein